MIDSLPELVVEILIDRFLSYEDRMNLKLTCKRIKNIVDEKKFKNLFIFFLAHPYPQNLYYTNETIGYVNSLRIHNPNSKVLNELSKFKETFNYLQKLIVYSMTGDCLNEDYTKFSLENLNHLEHLRHLELHGFNFLNGDLSLKNLKIISLDSNCTSELDCEHLKAINIEREARPKFTRRTASSLTHLSFGKYIFNGDGLKAYQSSLIENCENLSVLSMTEFENLYPILEEISGDKLKVPSLKEIRLERTRVLPDFEVFIQNLKPPFSPLNKIKIFLNGKLMLIDELIKLDNFAKKVENTFSYGLYLNEIEMINEDPLYDCLLAGLTHLEIMDNFKLNKQLIVKMRNVFFLKFNIKLKIDDELLDTMFETWKDKLRIIYFYCSPYITQNQFDRMPNYFTNKIFLSFREYNLENYEFLTRFKNLHGLSLSKEIKKDDLVRLLKECRLRKIQFLNNGKCLSIAINRQLNYINFFDRASRKEPVKFDNLENLIKYNL